MDPQGTSTGSTNVLLSSELTGTLVLNDPAITVDVTRAGQNGRYTLSGTASQQATVRVTNNTMSCVTVRLLRPDGTQLTALTSCNGGFNLATQTLPTTGTYTVTVDPNATNTGSLNLEVTNP